MRLTTNTETIYTTVEHPFYVNNGWVNASHLHAGDTLFSGTSAIIIVNSIFFIDTLVNVYNFTVETDHDYFVGESGVLVHNNPCDAASSGLKPLGLGTTGRTTALNLVEQMAMRDVMANPQLGTRLLEGMNDSRWQGWTKMEFKVKTAEGVNAIVHYVAKWENGVLKAVDDFKFK